MARDISQFEKSYINGFIPMLKEKFGIDAAEVVLLDRSKSCFAYSTLKGKTSKVPYLSIVAYDRSYEEIIETKNSGLVNDKYYRPIRDAFREYAESENMNIEECYDRKMYIGTSNYDDRCYKEFAYKQKDIVRSYLETKLGKAPYKIYASSMPSVNIVYETKDYNDLNLCDEALSRTVCTEIMSLATRFVESKYGRLVCHFHVNIFHPGMDNYNGYGLARED